jgi:hypothetical protein
MIHVTNPEDNHNLCEPASHYRSLQLSVHHRVIPPRIKPSPRSVRVHQPWCWCSRSPRPRSGLRKRERWYLQIASPTKFKGTFSIVVCPVQTAATHDLLERPVLGFGEEEVRDDRVGDVGDDVDQKVFPAQLVETTSERQQD